MGQEMEEGRSLLSFSFNLLLLSIFVAIGIGSSDSTKKGEGVVQQGEPVHPPPGGGGEGCEATGLLARVAIMYILSVLTVMTVQFHRGYSRLLL